MQDAERADSASMLEKLQKLQARIEKKQGSFIEVR
jgi:hypothetical protein